jgi:DNA-binding MarR family transcriptional regulator
MPELSTTAEPDSVTAQSPPLRGSADVPPPTTGSDDVSASDDVVRVADNFVGLMRSFARARAKMLAAAAHDVEWSAQILLKCLANEGSMRASSLAEFMQSDPSTVSRQVAGLVKDGLVERRADPDDGRASLLVLTPAAAGVLAAHDEIRLKHFGRMLATWDESDLRTFATLLAQFTRDFEKANHDMPIERLVPRADQSEGNR